MLVDHSVENINNPSNKSVPKLSIGPESYIKGSLVYYTKTRSAQNQINKTSIDVHVSSKANIFGSLFCKGNLEFLGKIQGSLLVDRFVLSAFGSQYANYLLDAQIDGVSMPPKIPSLPINNQDKSIAKWLY